ncbi:HAD family hydrolase [Pelagibacterium halotolerans]|uniref:HAD family hydrolase n=1 Tax=Pelagibacterium halotolerans TaxID=531813 RepID=UPI00384BEA01
MSPLAQPFDAVIFDMDGTLLDTESVFRSIVFEVCTELGYEMRDEVHASIVGSSHEATERMLVEAYGATFPYTLFDEKCRAAMHERTTHQGVPVKAGARELLTALRGRDVPLAVATSSRRPHATRHLSHAGLIELFDTVVTRDDVANPKPHPEPYLTAAARLGVSPGNCIAFEDSHSGVRAAHAAGMRTVMVPDLVGPTEEIAALCAAILESLSHAHDALFAVPQTTGD